LIATKSGGADPVSDVFGCLGKKLDTDATMARLRGRHIDELKPSPDGPRSR